MIVRIVFIALISLCSFQNIMSQGLNNLWVMGYESVTGRPFGGTNIDFSNGFADTSYVSRPMNLTITNANIADKNGSLLFYTNGVYIADASDGIMVNGSGLNPSPYTTTNSTNGLVITQANLILPKPGDLRFIIYFIVPLMIKCYSRLSLHYNH